MGRNMEVSGNKEKRQIGQSQHGVDIYGIPQGETDYYGVQCKGRDEYNNKQFTEQEIEEEVAKARLFVPKLKKFYLTTTAVKDVYIESIVNTKNLEHIRQGLFEIHLFSWEDLVDLIDENIQTHNWYVNSQNFRSNQSVTVTFHNGKEDLIVHPKFLQIITQYKLDHTDHSLYSSNVIKTKATPYYPPNPVSSLTSKFNLSPCTSSV